MYLPSDCVCYNKIKASLNTEIQFTDAHNENSNLLSTSWAMVHPKLLVGKPAVHTIA